MSPASSTAVDSLGCNPLDVDNIFFKRCRQIFNRQVEDCGEYVPAKNRNPATLFQSMISGAPILTDSGFLLITSTSRASKSSRARGTAYSPNLLGPGIWSRSRLAPGVARANSKNETSKSEEVGPADNASTLLDPCGFHCLRLLHKHNRASGKSMPGGETFRSAAAAVRLPLWFPNTDGGMNLTGYLLDGLDIPMLSRSRLSEGAKRPGWMFGFTTFSPRRSG